MEVAAIPGSVAMNKADHSGNTAAKLLTLSLFHQFEPKNASPFLARIDANSSAMSLDSYCATNVELEASP
jgi:hypothetical protein